MKQTAIEFLIEMFDLKSDFAIIEQAKEMEKQQMWDYIESNYVNGENSLAFHKEEFEQYYNEKFNK